MRKFAAYRLRHLITAFLVAGCSSACSPHDSTTDAEKAVAYKLLDPDAAKFRDVHVVAVDSVCGEVNGKNSFGAYVGYRKFVATKINKTDWDTNVQTDDSTEAQGRQCDQFLKNDENHLSNHGVEFKDACGLIDSSFWVVYLSTCGTKK